MSGLFKNSIASAALLMVLANVAVAELKLPSIIGENMVLQRDQKLPIWGWDAPGTEVTVSIGDQKVSAKADEDGRWLVNLKSMKAAESLEMTIQGSNEVKLSNVAVGEVWLCSGQSNMEWVVSNSDNPQEEIAAGNYPNIRHIKIPHSPKDAPQDNVPSGGWQATTPQTVGNFTAVGYFFGRELHKELNVPIGLIGSNWGGTRIEPWTPPIGFQKVPALKDIADNLDKFPQKNGNGAVNHQSPLALYNGMIAPLVPYGIRGSIWYQGESNRGEGMLYYEKMKALILGWREIWSNPEMPFYYVQLAPYNYGNNETALAEIQAAQTAALDIPHTGMAVTVDIGNVKDIHPRNKQDVGKRLALWALAKDYGKKDLVYSGPLYKSMKADGNKIVLHFNHVGQGLTSRDGNDLSHFEIAGADGNYVAAAATIEGDTVVVTAESVKEPKSVRFGWNHLAEPNLSNKNGLPASPFQTAK
jgi:sialate O-acetylesterase